MFKQSANRAVNETMEEILAASHPNSAEGKHSEDGWDWDGINSSAAQRVKVVEE